MEKVRFAREIRVAIELAHEDVHGGDGVGFGAVRADQFLAAVELHGCGQIARLALVENDEAVDDGAAFDGKRDGGAAELLDQERNVEAHDAEAAEIAALHEFHQRERQIIERRAAGDVFVGDAVHGDHFGRNAHAGIDAFEAFADLTVRRHAG